jgi:O-antigen/teichoic acid export membrane protein
VAEIASALPAQSIESGKPAGVLTSMARDAVSYSTASLLFFLINGVCAFLVPRLVSLDTYGMFKLFLLYGGYVGVLHLGSLDGALVRWAKEPATLIRQEFSPVLVSAITTSVAAVLVSLVILMGRPNQNGMWAIAVALALFAVASNAITTFQFAMQAGRRFRELSALSILQPAIFLVGVLVLEALGTITTNRLLFGYVASTCLTLVIYFVQLRGTVVWKLPSVVATAALSGTHLRSGLFILLSNLGFNLVLGLDRIFLSTRFTLRDFAIYSFAASIFYSVCLLIQAISKVVFPYVSQQTYSLEQRSSFLCAQRAVLAVWAIGLTAYFPANWLIRQLLPAYVGAIPILRILMLGLGTAAVIQIVHSNYFRAFAQERRMLLGTCVGLFAFLISLWFVAPLHSLIAIGWATVVAHTAWWTANESLLWRGTDRTFSSSLRDFVSIAAVAVLFLYCSQRPSVVTAAIYLATSTIGTAFVLGPRTILMVTERFVFAGEATS